MTQPFGEMTEDEMYIMDRDRREQSIRQPHTRRPTRRERKAKRRQAAAQRSVRAAMLIKRRNIFLAQMRVQRWPHFHMREVITGVELLPRRWKWLRKKCVLYTDQRSVIGVDGLGLTSRGEFIRLQLHWSQTTRIVDPADPRFPLERFEKWFDKLFIEFRIPFPEAPSAVTPS